MEKRLSFDSLNGHYEADACVVWCFDDRFSGLLGSFTGDFKNFDLVKIAGGAKALAGDASGDRDFVMNQIKTSIRLHHAKRIILMLHRDCGAYGGSKNFTDGGTDEKEYFASQLGAARNFIRKEIPDVPIDVYFADFDGLYALE